MWHILCAVAIKMLLSTAGKIRKIYLIEHTEVQFYFCHYFFAAVAVVLFLAPMPICDIIFITTFNRDTVDF